MTDNSNEMKEHIDPAIRLEREQKKRRRRSKKDYDPGKDPDQVKIVFPGEEGYDEWPDKQLGDSSKE